MSACPVHQVDQSSNPFEGQSRATTSPIQPLSYAAKLLGPLRKLRLLRRKYRAYVHHIGQVSGYCYTFQVPSYLLSDRDGKSRLVIFEDAHPLGCAHADHAEIASEGLGRYSHWGSWVLFSTSDNTDPRSNGRLYCIREV
jgi:hypothetical protein